MALNLRSSAGSQAIGQIKVSLPTTLGEGWGLAICDKLLRNQVEVVPTSVLAAWAGSILRIPVPFESRMVTHGLAARVPTVPLATTFPLANPLAFSPPIP